MNRLVIIGNGFDLAHGLPTGYCDFIDWYWKRVCENLRAKLDDDFPTIKSDNDFISIIIKFNCEVSAEDLSVFKKLNGYNDIYDLFNGFVKVKSTGKGFTYSFNYKNSFFKRVCDKNYENWVDIENEYYLLLKECLDEKDNKKVKNLNEEFEQVKSLLEEYLTTEVESKYKLEVNERVLDILTKTEYVFKEIPAFSRELQSEIEELNASKIMRRDFEIRKVKCLNFNYTSILQKTISFYDEDVYLCNQIHGELNSKNNPINFGFGDEMDDDYKTIEKKDDKEYLKNIKSFAYLNTPNYKNLIDFLELDKYQVYIMGHSCGLSDRILLNKVFEHKNCISIKIYYYQNDDYDNYTDIAQNVSRHFNKKEMMRERIVNKTYCEPLPQTKLPFKVEETEK